MLTRSLLAPILLAHIFEKLFVQKIVTFYFKFLLVESLKESSGSSIDEKLLDVIYEHSLKGLSGPPEMCFTKKLDRY